MVGICGWSNNQLALEDVGKTIHEMATRLIINRRHTSTLAMSEYSALLAADIPTRREVKRHEGFLAAIQGNPRWGDSELRQIAEAHGPARAAIDGFRKLGVEFLNTLSGPFTLAVIDENKHQTLLAIDKTGIGSLFFTHRHQQLIFSSNAKALRLHPDACKALDPQALFDYFYFHMVPSPRSIFQEVQKLLPGQYVLFAEDSPAKAFYWQPDYREPTRYDEAKLAEEFKSLLKSSVGRAAEGNNVGAFLSGGTDSSTVSGLLQEVKGDRASTFSIGFEAEGYDETQYARIAAKHFGTRPHEYYVTPQDVADALPLIAAAYDEPFGNASAVPVFYCAKMAKSNGMDCLLAGDGGDELFGGNERYAKQAIFEAYHHIPAVLRNLIIEPALFDLKFGEKLWPLAKARSYVRQANIPLPDRLEAYNHLNRDALTDLFEADFLVGLNQREPVELLRESYAGCNAASSLNRMLGLDLKFTLADNDLRKVNRMCELAQLEVGYPLLDEDLVGFSTALPSSLKVRGSRLRYFFKRALRDFLPEAVLNKEKKGFGLPFGLWLREHGPLRDLAGHHLENLAQRGLVRPEYLTRLQQNHQQYPQYYGVMIWVLIMLEEWLQTL